MEKKAHEYETLSYWLKFFSPVYVFLFSLYALFMIGYISIFEFSIVTIASLVMISIAVILQESFPHMFPYLGRNAYHSIGGIFIVIAGMFIIDALTLVILLFCVFLLFLTGTLTEWFNIETMFSRGHVKKHVKNFSKSSHYVAGTYWLFSCIVILLLFSLNICFASILILAVGDTAANYLGSKVGIVRNPLNRKKTVEGTIAFFSTSLFVAMLFVPTHIAVIAAFISAIVEALPLGINDNVSVPISAGLSIFILSYII